MSFTEDELQAFNTILERRLSAHRRDVEHALEQRLNAFRRDLDQRLATAQQEIVRTLSRQLSSQQQELNAAFSQRLVAQERHMLQAISQNAGQGQQHMKEVIEYTSTTQLQNIEHLLEQHLIGAGEALRQAETNEHLPPPQIETIEVQTDLVMEDLTAMFSKVLDARLGSLNESLQSMMRGWEEHFLTRLQALREQAQTYSSDISSATTTQDLINGIEHLERVVESMQVVMASNHALLSNRLYHHQQLPLERAHPHSRPRNAAINGANDPLTLPGERGEQP